MTPMKAVIGVVLLSAGAMAACGGVSTIGSGDAPGVGGGASNDPGLSGGDASGTKGAGFAGRTMTASGGAPDGATPPEVIGGTPAAGGEGGAPSDRYSGPFKVLILSTTLEFHHESIPACQSMLKTLGETPDVSMPKGTQPGSRFTTQVANADLSDFTADNLKQYGMLFWCNPTGTVFSNNPSAASTGFDGAAAMLAIQKFVEDGGAWGGVHSAADFEQTNGFPWFSNTLIGASFLDHDPDGTPGTVEVQPGFADHPVVRNLPSAWVVQDEWYYMNRDVSLLPGFQIIQTLATDHRPVTWTKEFGADQNGRMFYTIRGHNVTVYQEPAFQELVLSGILWATHRLQ